MNNHPFSETIVTKLIAITLLLLAIAIEWGILMMYCKTEFTAALASSLVSIGILAAAGYYSWYFITYIQVWQAQAVLGVTIQIVSQGVAFFVLSLLGLENIQENIYTLPLTLLLGTLYWVILLQWYWNLRKNEQIQAALDQAEEAKEPQLAEKLEHISVKDGTRIHIVHFAELIYLQASGDYVTLFTTSGQYIKEQTMKYFETNLPISFVRIHRSNIVNMEQILRVELFGKDNYQVRLKNGTSLRASSSGYKLLKERLNL